MTQAKYINTAPYIAISNAMILDFVQNNTQSWSDSDIEIIDYLEPSIDVDYDKILSAIDKEFTALKKALKKGKKDEAKQKSETRLGLEIFEFLKDVPQRIVWDKRFWLYISRKKPEWIKLRYQNTKKGTGEKELSSDRIRGRASRNAYAAATLVPLIIHRCGLEPKDYYEHLNARTRMFILDELPLSDQKLVRAFIEVCKECGKNHAKITDSKENYWEKIIQSFSTIIPEFLSQSEVKTLVKNCCLDLYPTP